MYNGLRSDPDSHTMQGFSLLVIVSEGDSRIRAVHLFDHKGVGLFSDLPHDLGGRLALQEVFSNGLKGKVEFKVCRNRLVVCLQLLVTLFLFGLLILNVSEKVTAEVDIIAADPADSFVNFAFAPAATV